MHEPTFEDPEIKRQIDEMIAHSKRNRLQRFYHTAGVLVCAQCIAVLGLAAYHFASFAGKHGAASSKVLFYASLLIVPAIIGFLVRSILIRHVEIAQRVLNAMAFVVIALAILLPKSSNTSPIIPLLWVAIIAYSAFHVSALFWLLSDASIARQRN